MERIVILSLCIILSAIAIIALTLEIGSISHAILMMSMVIGLGFLSITFKE